MLAGSTFTPGSTPLFQHFDGRRTRDSRRRALRSLAVSALVHAAILALAVLAGGRAGYALLDDGTLTGISQGAAGGGGGGGGFGGERVTYVDIAPPAAAAPEVTLTVPEATPPEPEVEPEPQPETPPPPAPAPPVPAPPAPAPAAGSQPGAGAPSAGQGGGAGAGQGAGQGEGVGPGTGPGSGGGSGGGTGGGIGSGVGPGTGAGRGTAPVPEFVLIPPSNAPRSVRGDSLMVKLDVDASGKVRDVEFRSTGDRGYDQKLRRTALEWRFRPARDTSNRPIPAAYVFALYF